MIRIIYITLFMSLLFVGCKKHTINKTERNIVKGDWVIRNYSEDGKDLTESGYSEYTFNFTKDGKVTARIQTLAVVVIGSWSGEKQEDKPVFDLQMNSPLTSLTEQWEILISQKNTITLSATYGENKKKTLVFYQIESEE